MFSAISALALEDSVRLALDFPSRVASVERWVAMMMEKRDPDVAIERTSRLLMAARGCLRIDSLVRRSDLSASQFQRRFESEVGMTPKLFARTIRFDAALAAHHNAPDRSWTDIVHELGYFDQAHFIGECRAFAGVLPERPRRRLGKHAFSGSMTKIYNRFRQLSRNVGPTIEGGGDENDAAQIGHRNSRHRCLQFHQRDHRDGFSQR